LSALKIEKKLDEILEVSRDNTKNIVLIMDTIKAPIAAWTAYIGAVKVGGWIGKVAKGFFWIIGTVLSFAVMVAIYIKTGIKIN